MPTEISGSLFRVVVGGFGVWVFFLRGRSRQCDSVCKQQADWIGGSGVGGLCMVEGCDVVG